MDDGKQDTPAGGASNETVAIRKVVARLRWRVRLQAALHHALLLGAIGLALFAAAVVLVKTRTVPSDTVLWAGALAIALPCLGLLVGVWRRLDDIRLASSLDAADGLHSRLGSALAFARLTDPTPMQRAAIEDAQAVLASARPAHASPWRWGAFAVGGAALLVAAGLAAPTVFAFEHPVGATQAAGLPPMGVAPALQRVRAEIRKDDQQRLEDLAKDITAETQITTDPAIKDFLDELNDLIRALHEGRISPEEAHAKMAALEKALEAWQAKNERGAQEAEKKLQEAAARQKQAHKELEPMLEALREKDWKEAADSLEKLAKKLEQSADRKKDDPDKLSERDQQKLAKDLEQLAKALESERQKDKDRLKKERDRLKEKLEKPKESDRFAQKDRDRLKDTERQLEQLDSPEQQAQQSEAERQLERLSEELDNAARDLMRRLQEQAEQAGQEPGKQGEQGPESEARRQQGESGESGRDGEPGGQQQGDMTAEDMKRATEALKRMAQGGQGRQQMRAAQGRMIDVREMMRRGQSGAGQQAGGKGQQGEQGATQGQPGEQGEGDEAQRMFEEGAQGGQQGEGGESGEGGKDGAGQKGMKLGKGAAKGGDMLLLGGKGQGGQKMPGKGQQGSGSDGELGEGIGQGHDARLMGERTAMDVATQDDFVGGQQGAGESKSKVLFTAAQKGFATRAYAEVHQNYSEVVEDSLEKEHIPPGKRTYVRRYFDLIRPR